MTPLMHVVIGDDSDAVLALPLLKAGAKLDLQDADGRTALMYAAQANDAASVRLLLSRGADRDLRDKAGGTALDLAAKENATEAAALLAPG